MTSAKLPIRILLLAVLTLLNGAATGQETSSDNLPQVYRVEVILFSYADPAKNSTESFLRPESSPSSPQEEAGDTESPSGDAAAKTPNGKLIWLPADATTGGLLNASRRLAGSAGYKMLAYRSWLQLAEEQNYAGSMELSELNIEPDTASGQLTLFQKQFLYLAAEIQFPDGNAGATKIIAGTRKLPLGKAIYFDDPQFGLIAMVSRSDLSWPGQTNTTEAASSEDAQ